MKKIKLKNLARITEYVTCFDLNVCNLPQKIIKQISKRNKNPRTYKKWARIEQRAYELGLFEVPSWEWATNMDITRKGQELVNKFYSGDHAKFKF